MTGMLTKHFKALLAWLWSGWLKTIREGTQVLTSVTKTTGDGSLEDVCEDLGFSGLDTQTGPKISVPALLKEARQRHQKSQANIPTDFQIDLCS